MTQLSALQVEMATWYGTKPTGHRKDIMKPVVCHVLLDEYKHVEER